MTISQTDRERLVKLVGMLGSAHDGEKLAVVSFISKMAAAHKLTITELMAHVAMPVQQRPQSRQQPPPWRPPRPPPPPPPPPEPRFKPLRHTGLNGDQMLYDLERAARYCLRLSDWERKFALDVSSRYKFDNELTDRQRVCVAAVLEKWKAGGA
jgi:hypothetical protein